MNFSKIDSSTGSAIIRNETTKYLAVASGLKNRSFTGVNTSSLQSSTGILTSGNEISNWKLEGITEIDNEIFFYGPFLKGSMLSDFEINKKIILKLAKAFKIIKNHGYSVSQFSLNSIYFTENNELLFFPPALTDFLNKQRLRQNRMEMITPFNNPDKEKNKSWSFSIAVITYKYLTGFYPFAGINEDEIEKKIYKNSYPSPLLYKPEIERKIINLLNESFTGVDNLDDWILLLSDSENNNIVNDSLTENEKLKILEDEKKIESKRLRKQKLLNFYEHNRIKLLISAVSIMIFSLFLISSLLKILSPPITIGKTQLEVIELYYDSYKNLDTEKISDCITSKSGKNDINEITTLFVTSKVRTSYEGSSGIISPDEWKRNGMELPETGVHIWGISGLLIEKVSEDIFKINYEKWTPAYSDETDENIRQFPDVQIITDTLHLSIIKKAWKIDELTRIYSEY